MVFWEPRFDVGLTAGTIGGVMKNLIRFFLLMLKKYYEKQIRKEFDAVLSRKLDCIIYLLEN